MATTDRAAPLAADPALALALDDAIRAGAIMLRSGSSAEGACAAVERIAAATAPPGTTIFLSADAIAASAVRDGIPVSLVRPVPPMTPHLDRASAVEELSEAVARGEVAPDEIGARLDAISGSPPRYGPGARALAAAAAGFGLAMVLGGDVGGAALAAVASTVGSLVLQAMRGHETSTPLSLLASGMVAGAIAGLGVRAGIAADRESVFVPAVAFVIPGFTTVTGVIDLVSIRFTGSGVLRTAMALLSFVLLGIGLGVGILLGGLR